MATKKKPKTPRERRITNLRNKISLTEHVIAARKGCKPGRRAKLMSVAGSCWDSDHDEWRRRITEQLDEMIEPANPIAEWLSDIGIHVAAELAIAIYTARGRALERGLKRDRATLERLLAEGGR
jgi:hypothetical protein